MWVEIIWGNALTVFATSRSPRSVWVEICYVFVKKKLHFSHAPHGACELKFVVSVFVAVFVLSRSPRSVWVEIDISVIRSMRNLVTLPTERVSWNEAYYCVDYNCCVTLPTERVSWNSVLTFILLQSVVTLPTERVSWNHSIVLYGFKAVTSRSPRSVWVEIRLNVYSLLRFSRHAPHGACELKL